MTTRLSECVNNGVLVCLAFVGIVLLTGSGRDTSPTDTPEFRLLFLGNSHTLMNDVPGMVRSLLGSAGSRATVQTIGGGLLDDLSKRQNVKDAVSKGNWTHVVLQGANMSSSHKLEYSKQGPIDLAKLAIKAGAWPVLYAEHPRRGWTEAAWIYGQYRQIQKAVGGDTSIRSQNSRFFRSGERKDLCPIVPCPFAFEIALEQNPKLDLWISDGNHASLAGSYLNSLTIAYWLAGPGAKLKFVLRGVDAVTARALAEAARRAVKEHL